MPPKRTWLQESGPRKYAMEAELPLRLRLTRWVGGQTWIPRGHDKLLRLLVHPDTCPHFFFDVDFFGQRYRGDLAHYVDWMVFCYGSIASTEVTLLKEVVEELRSKSSDPILFLDIGANAGHHTLFMAPIADKVISFEPYPPLQAQIQDKLELNKITNVALMPFGLGEQDQVLDYYPGEGANSGTGTFLPDDEEQLANPIKLQIRNGDSFLEQQGVGRVALLKIDVEGFEASVLRGLSQRIERDRPVILMELSAESRRQFGSVERFRQAFYPGAQISTVAGRNGCRFKLEPFEFETDSPIDLEVLVIPNDMGWLRDTLAQTRTSRPVSHS